MWTELNARIIKHDSIEKGRRNEEKILIGRGWANEIYIERDGGGGKRSYRLQKNAGRLSVTDVNLSSH